MQKHFFALLSLIILFFGCKEEDKIEKEIAKLEVNVSISRFDKEFSEANPNDLPKLRVKYPYLFPAPDSVWIQKMQDTIQQELMQEVSSEFSDFSKETLQLKDFYKHVKYYFPKYKVPHIITVTNDVDYNNRIILADSLLFIGLDNYLAQDHRFYSSIQRYISQGMDRKYIVSNIASAFANKAVPKPRDRTFLAQIIYYGKELYLKDRLLPNVADAIKIGYTEEQLNWAIANEEPIWRNFVEQEYLYSTNNNLRKRFLDPAPFSKFGLELDKESPGRIGRYIGWQIVKSFMEKNDLSLVQLMPVSAEEIFKKSNYKPKK
ncbi:gliding motility lipoprotein GldB [uncultured Maribacter sp.]|uniref:gliding motility lipoprotein GldB n=1 Tax=uncultured Maribacter sp. TaxID=431308 RepID=UPI002613861C|nr:gliding motility lipoprotein GldB [uncultured Maribacter sp.]